MPERKTSVTYFERSGLVNTEQTLRLARDRARDLKIKQVVLPSHSGETARKAIPLFKGMDTEIVCVSLPMGHATDVALLEKWGTHREIPELSVMLDSWRRQRTKTISTSISAETAEALRAEGVKVVYGANPYDTPPYNVPIKFPGLQQLGQAIILAIRLLGTGVEVAVKTTFIAVDQGAVAPGQEIIALGGVEQGVDSAIVLRAAKPSQIFDEKTGLDIHEVICKPRTSQGLSGKLLERISPM